MACALPAEQGVPLVALVGQRARARSRHARDRRADQRRDRLALAVSRTRSSPGSIARGSSRATRGSPRRPARSSTSTQGRWQGERLHPGDYVVCADEKPSIQARQRKHPTLPAAPRPRARPARRARVRTQGRALLPRRLGRPAREAVRPLRPQGRHRPVRRARRPVHEPTALHQAQRVFVIVDNGSAHRGQRSIDRLQGTWKNLVLVHTPIHASWLNQAEIYFCSRNARCSHPTTSPTSTRSRKQPARVRPPLRTDRRPVRMEVHPPRPRPTTRPPQRQRARRASPPDQPPAIRCRTSEPQHLAQR